MLSDGLWARCEPLIAQYDPEALPIGRQVLTVILRTVLTPRAGHEADGFEDGVPYVRDRWRRLGLLDALSGVILIQLDDAP